MTRPNAIPLAAAGALACLSISMLAATPAAGAGPALSALTTGREFACEARSADGGRQWPCRFCLTRYDPASGQVVGEVTWTSLGSVHEVQGSLDGERMTFTETRAIRAGGAHLNVVYELTLKASSAQGGWTDPADGSRGPMIIDLASATAASPTPAPAPVKPSGVAVLTSGRTLVCEARSQDGGRTWPCRLKITRYNAATGGVVGEVTWTSLGSTHVVEGTLRGSRLSFVETRAIRAGGAHLNVAYDMTVQAGAARGTWLDRSDGSRGPMTIDLSR